MGCFYSVCVAFERFDDVFATAAAAFVAQGGEFFRIALAGEDGGDDGLGTDSINVAKYMLDLDVHLGEGFLDELELFGCVAYHLGAVAHEKPQGHDVERGAK